jgi:hypothetical protein
LGLALFEQIRIILRSILHAAIGVMDQTGQWLSICQRHP